MATFDYPTNFTGASGATNVSGIGSLFQYAQYATGNLFGLGVVVLIWFITFVSTSMMNVGRAFAASSFIAFVFSIYFARIEAINPTVSIVLLLMTIVGFFWAKDERGSY